MQSINLYETQYHYVLITSSHGIVLGMLGKICCVFRLIDESFEGILGWQSSVSKEGKKNGN